MPGFSMPNFNFGFSGFNMPQIDLSRLNIPDISKMLRPTVEHPMVAQVQPRIDPMPVQPSAGISVGGSVAPSPVATVPTPAQVVPVPSPTAPVPLDPGLTVEQQIAELGGVPTLELPEFIPSAALFEPPEYTPYELTPYEEFAAPEYDPSQIRGRAQDIASPRTRRLQESLTQALSGTIENPNVRRMIERGALSGYSLGLEDIMGAARGQARGEYEQEYEELYDVSAREWETGMRDIQSQNITGEQAAQINYQRDLTSYSQEMQRAQDAQLIQYQTQLKEELANYNAALEEYFAKVERITTVREG